MHSEPYLSENSLIFVATSVMASSQEMRSQSLPPRAPTRRMGYLLRLGWYSAWMPAMPLAQMPPRLMGLSGFPSSLMTRPSFTWASTAQLAMHARHDVLTMVVWPLSAATAGSTATKSRAAPMPNAATAPSAATDLVKLLRVMFACVIYPPPRLSCARPCPAPCLLPKRRNRGRPPSPRGCRVCACRQKRTGDRRGPLAPLFVILLSFRATPALRGSPVVDG